MVAYDLIDPLEFVGYGSGSGLTGLQVVKARNKDEANPSSRSFTPMTTIGSAGSSIYTELKVFNGTVTASSLPGLMADLRDKNLWVNCDGYCYIRIPGSRSSNPPRPTKFMRLNDLFNWEDYVDSVPAGQTFTPTPSTTVWNRHDSSSGTTKVDYKKLDADLKQAKVDKKKAEGDKKKAEDDKKKAENDKKKAEDDKKKAEDDKKKAENDKKKAEDDKKKAENDKKKAEDDKKKAENDKKKAENDKKKAEDNKKKTEDKLRKVRKQKREMNEWMHRLKENWVKAARVGARPLPPSAFYIRSKPKPLPRYPLCNTWLGDMQKRVSDPGSYIGSIGTRSIQLHNAVEGYGNDGFETHFWWVVQMDCPNNGIYGFMIAFDGTGRYPSPTDKLNFQKICIENSNYVGSLHLSGVGDMNVIILRLAPGLKIY